MFNHGIVTPAFRFNLINWVRSIENLGGFPIIKYTARAEDATAQISFEYITHNFPSVFETAVTNVDCEPGMEILLIGETIHFPVTLASTLPLINPRPEGLNGN
jgi:hypothetical protein